MILPLKRKTEKNLIYWLGIQFPELTIYPGQAYGLDAEIKLPALVVEASAAQPDEEVNDDAVATVTASVTIITDTRVDGDAAQADSLMETIWEELLREELPDEWHEDIADFPEPGYFLYEIMSGGEDTQYSGDERRDIINLNILCHNLPDPEPEP